MNHSCASVSHDKMFISSLWASITPPIPSYPTLNNKIDVDTLIIGGGLTGLAAALYLGEKGRAVALIEAENIGFGASGRNNGQIIPTMTAIEPDVMVARFGETGRRFVELVGNSASKLFTLIREEELVKEAEAEQSGWFQPAHSPGRTKLSQSRVEAWQRFGFSPRYLDRKQASDLLGTDSWYGGMLNETGGHVNPLGLVRGLSQRATKKNVQIYQQTPALDYYAHKGGWFTQTPGGSITSKNLLVASNAYTVETAAPIVGKLAKQLGQTIVPVLSWQMATTPLEPSLRQRIVPGRQAVSDTRGDLRFFRYDARHRLITGGVILGNKQAQKRVAQKVVRDLTQSYPDLTAIQMSHVWSGYLGVTYDRFPHIHRIGANGWCWIGCNGRGVALAVALGQELARAIDAEARGKSIDDLALPLTDCQAYPVQKIAKYFAPYHLAYLRQKDKKEIKK